MLCKWFDTQVAWVVSFNEAMQMQHLIFIKGLMIMQQSNALDIS